MWSQRPTSVSESSEEERAFLQMRVALFWKVIFFITLLSSGLGAFGAVARPGVDLLLVLASTAQADIFWWLCLRGQRSIRVEACPVEPWDSAKALAWWREYQPDLADDAGQSIGEVMTIAVDGARRSSALGAAVMTLP